MVMSARRERTPLRPRIFWSPGTLCLIWPWRHSGQPPKAKIIAKKTLGLANVHQVNPKQESGLGKAPEKLPVNGCLVEAPAVEVTLKALQWKCSPSQGGDCPDHAPNLPSTTSNFADLLCSTSKEQPWGGRLALEVSLPLLSNSILLLIAKTLGWRCLLEQNDIIGMMMIKVFRFFIFFWEIQLFGLNLEQNILLIF